MEEEGAWEHPASLEQPPSSWRRAVPFRQWTGPPLLHWTGPPLLHWTGPPFLHWTGPPLLHWPAQGWPGGSAYAPAPPAGARLLAQ